MIGVRRIVIFVVLAAAMLATLGSSAQPRRPDHSPNHDLFVYRRAYTPDEPLSFRLSTYNERSVRFSAYRVDLAKLAPNPKAIEDIAKRIKALDLSRQPRVKSWTYKVNDLHPDEWSEREVKAPRLAPGTY